MRKKTICAAILLASVSSARADWDIHVIEDPMTDEKTVIMYLSTLVTIDSGFVVRYTCWSDKEKSRMFEIWPYPTMQYLIHDEQPARIRVRFDSEKIHTFEFSPEKAPSHLFEGRMLFAYRYTHDSSSEAKRFADFEKDLFESKRRIVFEVKGETRAIDSGDAQEAAKKVIEICGTVY